MRVLFSVNYKLDYFDVFLHSLKASAASASDSPGEKDTDNEKALLWECILICSDYLQIHGCIRI